MVLEITSAQTSHLLDTEHQGSTNCNNLSSATEQSQFDNYYLLISFMLKATWTFLPVPGAYSAICIGKYRGRESPGFTTVRQLPQCRHHPGQAPAVKAHHWPMKLKLPFPLSTKKVLQPQWSKNSIIIMYLNCIFPNFKICPDLPIRAFQSPSYWEEWNKRCWNLILRWKMKITFKRTTHHFFNNC